MSYFLKIKAGMIQCDACLYKNIQTLEVDAPCRSPVYPSSYEPLEGTQKYPIICLKTANTACQLQSFNYEENTSDQVRRCPNFNCSGSTSSKAKAHISVDGLYYILYSYYCNHNYYLPGQVKGLVEPVDTKQGWR